MPDSGSAKKRRHRRLFEELQQQGLADDGYGDYYYGQEYGNQQWSDEEGGAPGGGGGYGGSRYNHGDIEDDDVGEGVDALLSLASLAHASSSCQTDSQAVAGEDAGPAAAAAAGRSKSAGRSRSGRSGSLKAAGRAGGVKPAAAAAAGGDGDGGDVEDGEQEDAEHGDDYWGAFEAAAAAVEAAERAKSAGAGDGSSDDMDADEAAAGGLAQMRGSQRFFTTPQKRTGSGSLQELFYRTGTPGGRAEYLLASPSDRPPLGLPSPNGSRGRRGGAPPKSPAGRKALAKGKRGKAARGAAGRAAAAAARAAAASQGSSGQRGGTVGRAAAAAAAAEGMDLDDGGGGMGGMAGLLVSESELLSDVDNDYMDGGMHLQGGHSKGLLVFWLYLFNSSTLCNQPTCLFARHAVLKCQRLARRGHVSLCRVFFLFLNFVCSSLPACTCPLHSPSHSSCPPTQSQAWHLPASARPTCAHTVHRSPHAAWCCSASAGWKRTRASRRQPQSCAACGRRPRRATCPSCCRSRCSQQAARALLAGTATTAIIISMVGGSTTIIIIMRTLGAGMRAGP